MPWVIPDAPALPEDFVPAAPGTPYPPVGPFVLPTVNFDPFADPQDGEPTLPQGPFPGVVVDIKDTIKRLEKSSIPGQAYDAWVFHFLVESLQFFGDAAATTIPQGQPRQGERTLLKYHVQYKRVVQVMQQWASYKNTSINDPSLGRQLQFNQNRSNVAPNSDPIAVQQAALDVERRALLNLASGSGKRRGGSSNRGRGRGRGGSSTGASTRTQQTIQNA